MSIDENFVSTDEPRIVDEPVSELWKKYRSSILMVCLGGLVVLGLSIWYWQTKRTHLLESRKLLMKAEGVAGLEDVVSKYPDTSSAASALLQLAQKSKEGGDVAKTVSYYEDFRKRFPDHPLRPAVDFAYAQDLDYQGESERAKQMYEEMIAASPVHPLAGAAALELAQVYQKEGNQAKAREIAQDFLDRGTQSAFLEDLKDLLEKLPQEKAAVSSKEENK